MPKENLLSKSDEQKFIEIYQSGKFLRKEMVQFFPQLTAKQCISFILNHKITNGSQIEWSKEEDDLLKSLVESCKYTYNQMLQFFKNRSRSSLINRVQKLGITNINKTSVIYSFDETYFDELTLENIYWGGLFCADGCIYKKKNQQVFQWTVAEKDREHMEYFCSLIKSNYPLKERYSVSPQDINKKFKQISFSTVRARRWNENLKKYFGIIQNKTKRFPPPNLENNIQKLAYYRGYIDGDGSISSCRQNPSTFSIKVASSNKEIIVWFKELVDSFNFPGLRKTAKSISVFFTSSNNCYVYSITGFKAAILFELMKRLQTPFLKRKWNDENILKIVNFHKNRPEWPNELFFQNILNS